MKTAQNTAAQQSEQVDRAAALLDMQQWIARHVPRCALRLNKNRQTLLSMRRQQGGGFVVSMHERLLDDEHVIEDLKRWIVSRGRVTTPYLQTVMRDIFRETKRMDDMRAGDERAALSQLPSPIQPLDLEAALEHVHGTWFSHLPKPRITWSRNPGRRALSSIRFGCYITRPYPTISLHPRLQRAFVSWIFIEHVLFHELCHHAQAQNPIPREPHHSARFKAWERLYPNHEVAKRWERAYLDDILAGDE